MSEFRLTQISDTHLARRLQKAHRQFSSRQRAYRRDAAGSRRSTAAISPSTRRPARTISKFAKELHDALPVPCRHLPGNHDIGDNPTAVGPAPKQPATEQERQNYLVRHRRGPLALRRSRLVLYRAELADHEHRDRERGRAVRLAGVRARHANGKPVALFLHKPLFLNAPDDPELEASAIRYVPQPRRKELIEMSAAVDLRLVASGHVHQRRDFTFGHTRHVWAPSAGFILPERMQRSHRHQGNRAGGVSLSARQF